MTLDHDIYSCPHKDGVRKNTGKLMIENDESKTKCKRCNGRGEYRVRFYYKDKHYYYYSKCGHCYARGYIDWVEAARGRKPGIAGLFVDTHPAGSCRIVSDSVAKDLGWYSAIYDGHNYIETNTERGKALWNELITKQY